MICDELKLIYIHIPKTGGVSVEDVLKKYSNDKVKGNDRKQSVVNEKFAMFGNIANYKHATVVEIKQMYPVKFEKYKKIVTVRNTFERLISLYFWSNGGGFNKDKFKNMILKKNVKTVNRSGFDPRPHWGVEDYITNKNGDIIVDQIIMFDELVNSYNLLFDEYGIQEKMPHLNKTKHRHYSSYYDKDLHDMVKNVYSYEIEKFDFKL